MWLNSKYIKVWSKCKKDWEQDSCKCNFRSQWRSSQGDSVGIWGKDYQNGKGKKVG
jgi:hypothetical protein